MAPTFLIGSWIVLAGHALASAGHHHAHFHHHRDTPVVGILNVPAPDKVANFARVAQTTAPAMLPGLSDSCSEVNEAIVECAAIIPNFGKADAKQIGQCLCCDGTNFAPNQFQGKAAQCAAYIKGVAPQSADAINQWAGLASFCGPNGPAGNMAGVCTSSYSYKPKPPKTVAQVAAPVSAAIAPACVSLQAINNACVSETPGFGQLPPKSQAECYCYSSSQQTTTWMPEQFDNYASKCAAWAEAAGQPSLCSVAEGLAGICTKYGNFLSAGAGTTTTAEFAAAAVPTMGFGGYTSSTTPGSSYLITTPSETSAPARTAPTADQSSATSTTISAAVNIQSPATWILSVGAISWALYLSMAI